jgi:hypothetical protein
MQIAEVYVTDRLICFYLFFVGCSESEITHHACTARATIRDLTGLDGCGFVFELDNGEKIEPLPGELPEDPLTNFEFVDGKKVFISYEPDDRWGSYCMVGLVAKITCVSEVSE